MHISKYFLIVGLLVMVSGISYGQKSNSEAGQPQSRPLNGIYEKEDANNRRVLKYDPVREADVFWEKRIWRVIDVREKLNQHFVYPKAPFVQILMDAATRSDITVYSGMDDEFNYPLTKQEAAAIGKRTDTTIIIDPITLKEIPKVYTEDFNWETVKRFRIKEVWYFDEETSTMKSRILGIAPLQEVYDDNDNFRYEQPVFWAYYPDVRGILAVEQAFNRQNDATVMSWEDIFEMRYFASYIYKESNIKDYRIQDYKSGLDIILEAEKISDAIFAFEQNLWSE